ncbi:DUF5753 domain-containing protein [Streptomyces sp. B1866]|uniref:DUF5753 domain-containing protein n=1 Tax=Streptomyces sp. B1866 TaxID=3075431 RepID=UPI002891B933|nr:DUF5753 domain-containing protein [Streptomyces sp. B1866]MDT3400806.1 DUF5753 domain-containing protein [Streptomyces sp. B1866]
MRGRAEPPFYWSIIDEAALKRPIGGNRVMRVQLEYLLQAAENPHITVQVLPFTQRAHPMLGGNLTILALKEGGMVGAVESLKTAEPVESPRKIVELIQLFEMACSQALSKTESLDLIRHYLK